MSSKKVAEAVVVTVVTFSRIVVSAHLSTMVSISISNCGTLTAFCSAVPMVMSNGVVSINDAMTVQTLLLATLPQTACILR